MNQRIAEYEDLYEMYKVSNIGSDNIQILVANPSEGLIYLFTQWLDIVCPDDFDNGTGNSLVGVK